VKSGTVQMVDEF